VSDVHVASSRLDLQRWYERIETVLEVTGTHDREGQGRMGQDVMENQEKKE
jgi:hypothetical protein